ncbi:MAG: hypothetical protein V7L11_27605, partial [Nostoc sp.]|uniref:hypothetical protein n=1 Tax=Nostoc sp. TaxID=1180 RepID=UPI002FFBE3DF
NSEVKRCCGHDSLGVALRKNSSMPGLFLQTKSLSNKIREAFSLISVYLKFINLFCIKTPF